MEDREFERARMRAIRKYSALGLFLVFLAIMMMSCQSVPIDPGVPAMVDPRLKAQLAFTANGVAFPSGVGTVQRSSMVNIKVSLPENTYLLLLRTCARQDEFWSPARDFKYDFMTGFDAENFGSCPMYIIAVTKNGEYHKSILDFTNSVGDDATVDVMCNGRWETRIGSDICQVAAELPVKVWSTKSAVFKKDPDSKCPEPVVESPRHFTINTKKPEPAQSPMCVYVLINKDQEEFRLTTTTYTSILNVYPPTK